MASNSAEYQRAYRARRKEGPVDPVKDISIQLEDRLKRQQADQRLVNPFTDGLPDWGELIQGMTQKQRDRVLDHPAIKTTKHAS